MINEEDHLRIQVMQSGLDLHSAWERINRIDDLIEEKVTYAFHERLGYLTACPTNVGTGMRVSVMLHLPALVHHPADRQGLPQPAKDQPGGPRPVRRRLAGDGRFLPDQQPDHAGPQRAGADQAGRRHRAGDHRLRAPGPRLPHQGKPREPARPREPGLRHPPHRPDHQLRRDDAPACPACGWA